MHFFVLPHSLTDRRLLFMVDLSKSTWLFSFPKSRTLIQLHESLHGISLTSHYQYHYSCTSGPLQSNHLNSSTVSFLQNKNAAHWPAGGWHTQCGAKGMHHICRTQSLGMEFCHITQNTHNPKLRNFLISGIFHFAVNQGWLRVMETLEREIMDMQWVLY